LIRIALCLLLGGCTTGVVVLPVVNPTTYDASCCIAYWALSKSTSGSLEVQKSATTWSVNSKLHIKF
jgi:hypothetical protein